MQDEFLTRCVVDPLKRKFYLYSSEGDEKTVDCENMEEFMNVLELVRRITPEDVLAYANPLWPKTTLAFIFGRKKSRQKFDPISLFMIKYSPDFYKEILKCYEYETRNPTIYGNVIRGEMEFTKSSEELRSDGQGDENHL